MKRRYSKSRSHRRSSTTRSLSLRKFYQQERYAVLALVMAMTQMLVATSHGSASLFSFSIVIILTTFILNWWKQQKKSNRRRKTSRFNNYNSRRYDRYDRSPSYSYSYDRYGEYEYNYDSYDYPDDYNLVPLPRLKRKRDYRR